MYTRLIKRKTVYFTIVLLMMLVLVCASGCIPDGKLDDWQEQAPAETEGGWFQGAAKHGSPQPTAAPSAPSISSSPSPSFSAAESDSIGLAVGGAKDINNFRENINNNYLPIPTDVTYEGLFYDYYFDTGDSGDCDKLFCPSYSFAITEDPFSGEEQYYLSVGLNSGLKESDFQRKKLNLVIVLDISGSMTSAFNEYYYDNFGNKVVIDETGRDNRKSKIEIATESVVALLDHLQDDDRFGMVLYNDSAYLAKPMNPVGNTDMEAIKDHILEIAAGGGTRMSAGMQMATEMYRELENIDRSEYENRIIFLTDAMPNLGLTGEDDLLDITEGNAAGGIYTTFIGIGVDFNTELVEYITKIKGANYYSVHSAGQFRERMDDEFEYMVTPLVFDLRLTLDASGWEIEKVYGSPEANESTGELMKVNTLFPSSRKEGETRGGLILLKLRKTAPDNTLNLRVSYEDRNGRSDTAITTVKLQYISPEYFGNTGIRKGILLARYADLLKNWIIDEHEHAHLSMTWKPAVDSEYGIIVPPSDDFYLGRWERQSLPLMVSGPYRELFGEFSGYFAEEMSALNDDTLGQELDILRKLS